MMREEKIVQFVVFETALDSDAFLGRWKQYKRSIDDEVSVTLQQREVKNGKFKYISQHKCSSGDFHFIFEKDRRGVKTQEAAVRQKLAGGYTALQHDHSGETKANESKIIVFVLDPRTDLDDFRQFSVHGKLNIYEAYYENCEFAYILEFFVKNEYAADVLKQLKILTSFAEAGIYKECHA
jgi:hypothetical protein